MSLRSPLGRVLGSGSARDGTGHWWAQRVSAVALVLLGAWFLVSLLALPGLQHGDVLEWIGDPWHGVMLLLFATTLAYHSWLGVQVVIEDYVHGPVIKVASLVLNKFAHAFVATVAAYAVLRIALGGMA